MERTAAFVSPSAVPSNASLTADSLLKTPRCAPVRFNMTQNVTAAPVPRPRFPSTIKLSVPRTGTNVQAPVTTTQYKKRGRGRLTIEELQKNAEERGGRLLSKTYEHSHKPLKWQCAHGHEWEAKPCNIRSAKSWCPICANNSRKHTIQDMMKVAQKFNGICLSDTYEGEHVKLQWKCEHGHIFWKAPNNINRSPNSSKKPSWCNICAKSQRDLTKLKLSQISTDSSDYL